MMEKMYFSRNFLKQKPLEIVGGCELCDVSLWPAEILFGISTEFTKFQVPRF
jgi:hypothetical protein